jgi:hypothetical protein
VGDEVKVPPNARIPDPMELGDSSATTLPDG